MLSRNHGARTPWCHCLMQRSMMASSKEIRKRGWHPPLVGFVLTGLPKLTRTKAAEHLKRFVALELGLAQ